MNPRIFHLLFLLAIIANSDYASSEVLASRLVAGDEFPNSIRPEWNEDDPWIVDGQVYDKDGQAITDCDLALVAQPHSMDSPRNPALVVAETRSDNQGKFILKAASLEWYQCRFLHLIARRNGFSIELKQLDLASKRKHFDRLQLSRSKQVRGTLKNSAGNPLSNVQLRVDMVTSKTDGTVLMRKSSNPPDAWFSVITTGLDGSFVIPDLGSENIVRLEYSTDDRRLSPSPIVASIGLSTAEIALIIEPCLEVHGQVVCRDSRSPIANAWMIVVSLPHAVSKGADQQSQGVETRTDEQGHFHARVRPGKFVTTYVYPSPNQPYPAWMEQQAVPAENSTPLKPIEVPRGVLVKGRILEEKSGLPIVGAGVEYIPSFDAKNRKYPGIHNPHYGQEAEDITRQVYWATERHRVLSDEQGNYRIAVLAGKGHLMVKAPTPDYVSLPITRGELQWGRPASSYYCVEGIQEIDIAPTPEEVQFELTLRKGEELSGTVVDSDGRPIDKAVLLSTTHSPLWINGPNFRPRTIRGGTWHVSGLHFSMPQRICFFDAERNLGATVAISQFSRDRTARTVRLMPCGSAKVKLVDRDKKPFANARYMRGDQPLGMMLIEGFPAPPRDEYFLTAGPDSLHWLMEELAYTQYHALSTNDQGEIVFPCLIPGATCVFYSYAGGEGRELFRESKAFRLYSGEQLDLGTVTVPRK